MIVYHVVKQQEYSIRQVLLCDVFARAGVAEQRHLSARAITSHRLRRHCRVHTGGRISDHFCETRCLLASSNQSLVPV